MIFSALVRTPDMANITVIARQLGTHVLPDNKSHTHRMEIHSGTSNRVYIVAQRKTQGEHTGRWECSCMGWIRYKRPCKHLKTMMPTLAQLGTPTPRSID